MSEQLDLFEVTLGSPWYELKTPERWAKWLEIAEVESPDAYDWWMTMEGCGGCKHHAEKINFCNLQQLPAAYNPVTKILGMACMGVGYNL